MAKYCYKCGAEMDKEDGFCSKCGTAVVELGEKKKERITKTANNIKNHKRMRNVIIAAVVVIGLLFAVKSKKDSSDYCEKLLKKVTINLKKGDADALMDLAAEEGYAYYMVTREASKSQVTNYYRYCIEETLDRFENEVGDIEDISFEIDEITDCLEFTGKTPEEWIRGNAFGDDRLPNMYDAKELKAVYLVEWNITVTGKDGVYKAAVNEESGATYVLKEGDEWKMTFIPFWLSFS